MKWERKDEPLQGSVQFNAETGTGPQPPRSDRSNQDIKQDRVVWSVVQKQCDRYFDIVKIKYLKFDNVKSGMLMN